MSNVKGYYKLKNKCKSRSCVWWLVLNLSWYRRNYLFLLNFDISFVSITVSIFETIIITEALTIPFPFSVYFAISGRKLILNLQFRISNTTPQYLRSLIPQRMQNISRYPLRNMNDLIVPNASTVLYANSFRPSTIRNWESLDLNVSNSPSLNTFK